MSVTNPELEKLRGTFLNGSGVSRRWDLLLVVSVVFVVIAANMLIHILTIGDWDFWVDWKDRQWWPTLTPLILIVIPAGLQFIAWRKLRLPVGATIGSVLLFLGLLLSRTTNWGLWTELPVSYVMTSTTIPAAVILDCILLATRSFVVTSLVGSLAFGILFQPMNAVLFGAFWQPVDFHGTTLTLADVMGFNYTRTQTPIYLRIIERGTFRAFLEQISYVVAIFSGLICIAGYWFGQMLGRVLAVNPADQFLSGKKYLDQVDEDPPEAAPLLVSAGLGASS